MIIYGESGCLCDKLHIKRQNLSIVCPFFLKLVFLSRQVFKRTNYVTAYM